VAEAGEKGEDVDAGHITKDVGHNTKYKRHGTKVKDEDTEGEGVGGEEEEGWDSSILSKSRTA